MELTPAYNPEHRSIINEFIRTKLEESGTKGVVLGLSGGVDSAVVAALALEAVGKNRVHCLIMPYDKEMDREAVGDAVEIAGQCGLDHELVSIREGVDAILISAASRGITENCRVMAAGNVKARMRMVALYYYANLHGYLVIGTSNKSELLVGYFTKYGDGGNDAMPIGDLYKTQVYSLAKELGIPGKIISKPPSAGLVRGQSDEKDLGINYSDLDRILYGIELRLGLEDISEITGILLSTVKRIQGMVHRAAHKRYLGMIPKLGLRTPGYDWRENVSLLSFSHESP